jgi:excisionase family DNA binding protein
MPKLLSRVQTAEYLNVSPQTVSRLIADGKLTAIRVGVRKLAVTLSSVERYLVTCKIIAKENE